MGDAKGFNDQKHDWNGKHDFEKNLYHPKAKVLSQKKAWLDEENALIFFKWICPIMEKEKEKWSDNNPDFPYEPRVLIQQDNLTAQNTRTIKLETFKYDIFVWNTIENCTDAVAWMDQFPLWDLKTEIDKLFWEDFESSPEATDFYSNPVSAGGITTAQWRIAITFWVMKAWEITRQKRSKFLNSARKVGLANCRCGCENHYIQVGKLTTYRVGKQTDPPLAPLSKDAAAALAAASKRERAERRKAGQKKLRAGAKLAIRLRKAQQKS